jgi:uncharacterized protein (TIGR02453 family)
VSSQRYFDREFFGFLKDLAAHNNRDWFESNRGRYEQSVRDPFLRLITDLQPPLRKINPQIVADPRPNGGSMMRIYRDIRFSKDKSPYKTSVAAHFWHAKGKDGATPAYYLHLAPGASLIGSGIWRPEPAALKGIRQAIVKQPKQWQEITSGRDFRSTCGLGGESLQRPPAGFDPNHPLIADIKRKDFVTSFKLTDKEVYADVFLDSVIENFRLTAPFVKFLSRAVGLS